MRPYLHSNKVLIFIEKIYRLVPVFILLVWERVFLVQKSKAYLQFK
jgi:hypothetical protein